MNNYHRHLQRVLAAVCALCVGILLARSVGLWAGRVQFCQI